MAKAILFRACLAHKYTSGHKRWRFVQNLTTTVSARPRFFVQSLQDPRPRVTRATIALYMGKEVSVWGLNNEQV